MAKTPAEKWKEQIQKYKKNSKLQEWPSNNIKQMLKQHI